MGKFKTFHNDFFPEFGELEKKHVQSKKVEITDHLTEKTVAKLLQRLSALYVVRFLSGRKKGMAGIRPPFFLSLFLAPLLSPRLQSRKPRHR